MVPHARPPSEGRAPAGETGVFEYALAAVCLAVTGAGLVAFAPALLSLPHPLPFLAATALVGLFALAWLAVCACLETARTRLVERPNGS